MDYTEELSTSVDETGEAAKLRHRYLLNKASIFLRDKISGVGPRLAIICPTSDEFNALLNIFRHEPTDVIEEIEDPPLSGVTNDSSLSYRTIRFRNRSGKDATVLACYARDQGVAATVYTATAMIKDFPLISHVILCGVSAGVPHPVPLATDTDFSNLSEEDQAKKISECSENHVNLGDIVVGQSAFQFDFGKITPQGFARRDLAKLACPRLLQVVEDLYLERRTDQPWSKYIESALRNLDLQQPDATKDVLYDWSIKTTKKGRVREKRQSLRVVPPRLASDPPEGPNIRKVTIGTSNAVIKDPRVRQFLWDNHEIGAIEMEGAAAADAVIRSGADFLIVRGISDYSSPDKNNDWWMYSAVCAASFTRCIVERFCD